MGVGGDEGKKTTRNSCNQDNDYDDVSKEFFISDSYNQHTLQVFTIDKGNGKKKSLKKLLIHGC